MPELKDQLGIRVVPNNAMEPGHAMLIDPELEAKVHQLAIAKAFATPVSDSETGRTRYIKLSDEQLQQEIVKLTTEAMQHNRVVLATSIGATADESREKQPRSRLL